MISKCIGCVAMLIPFFHNVPASPRSELGESTPLLFFNDWPGTEVDVSIISVHLFVSLLELPVWDFLFSLTSIRSLISTFFISALPLSFSRAFLESLFWYFSLYPIENRAFQSSLRDRSWASVDRPVGTLGGLVDPITSGASTLWFQVRVGCVKWSILFYPCFIENSYLLPLSSQFGYISSLFSFQKWRLLQKSKSKNMLWTIIWGYWVGTKPIEKSCIALFWKVVSYWGGSVTVS